MKTVRALWVRSLCVGLVFLSLLLQACAEGEVDGTSEVPVVATCTAGTLRPPVEEVLFAELYARRGFLADGNHLGRDVRLAEGTPVYPIGCGILRVYRAAQGYGTLVAVVEHLLPHSVQVTNGVGERVTITRFLSIYGHLRQTEGRSGSGTGLAVGQQVRMDRPLGYVERDALNGDGAEHLHVGIRLQSMADAQREDPSAWFRGYDRSPSVRRSFADPATFLSEVRMQLEGESSAPPCVHDASPTIMDASAASDAMPSPAVTPMPDASLPMMPPPPITPPMTADAGMSPMMRELVVTPSATLRALCPGRLQMLTWDPNGRTIASAADQPLMLRFPWTWRGYLMVSARCDSVYPSFDPPGRTARMGGINSILQDGEDIVDQVQTCRDPWGVGTKFAIPLDRASRGLCPE